MTRYVSRQTALGLLGALAGALLLAAPASAQHTTTGVGTGSDFWTGSMDPELFQLHENGGAKACVAGEVFVAVRGTLGFCMDANENGAGSVEWEDAREICAAAGKRLPEPAEYKFACQAGIAGLNNMTNDSEWISNFAYTTFNVGTPNIRAYSSIVGGNMSCQRILYTFIGNEQATATSVPFRCVR